MGIHSESVKREFGQHAREEEQHALMLAEHPALMTHASIPAEA